MIKILNTISGKKEELAPMDSKKVRMFVCGPTVYDYIHIGNARTFVFFDVVAKYLRYEGYKIDYIQNITDIDNKIIEQAQKEGVDSLEYAKKYSDIFKEDMLALGVTSPEYKNATDHIPQVIKQVQTLLDKGNAYTIENDGIYFDLSTFPDYGKLSGRTSGMADDAVSRIDDSDKKRNRGDFALWKFSQKSDPSWPAQFGDGRPGWHIEDTAITDKYFGPQYDIHGGGQDLIFPHHEAEITQQEAASGKKPFVKYWMHVAFVVSKEQKMSKSLGNFATVRQLLKKYPKEVLRFYLLSGYYRSPLEFGDKALKQAEAGVGRITEFVQKLNLSDGNGKENIEEASTQSQKQFTEAMDNDFNTPDALGSVFEFIRTANPMVNTNSLDTKSINSVKLYLEKVNSILGIVTTDKKEIPEEIQKMIKEREKFRAEKNYEESDKLRDKIRSLGYEIEDTIYGPIATKQ
ncbi:MAG: cysteine--tRNA ligase [Candidatus Yanofskybacteria bacterium RIFCSPHIGHO2_01_FULL_43_42]|uniref:Cysteine--tRNA ligase n=1 Tax=Candidatus Yanofskybacteria bacterium RIFCSPLOWO2_01_FULL_43_22 TaxID=1802695 RepID=A0A1F8GD65_9BACT|nr:MAG: cysteine--tRNA ligase [Candidatus Yanofskybacteria bacterium RIFCSPHIGHO2_01_FULL_43_42]OGN12650.1 MAG: cysteine--tRNA ligase [Candidatus Yanofskybacteria bacterium RIFCSPHIGHO2_02_FULL_43_17]OGN23273.1 MAG: cysteine--tRNA ligase [Candidatus Yanofskybacteria bacterium RIFCSPLOWO2_01_FULL_43_22]